MKASGPHQLDLVITIPETLGHGATSGCWASRHGVAKLQRKYGDKFVHSREFDGYAAARASQDPSWCNRIEMADLLATWLMQSQIERRPGAIEAVMERRASIEDELAKVPEYLALEQEIPEQTWRQLGLLFKAFRVPGVALATMTKVLCMKRPALIPMMDGHVMGFLFQRKGPQSGVVGMKQFRALMLYGENLKVLAAIRDELTPWLARLEVSSRAAPKPSLARVLDSLLWYDWNGHTYFYFGGIVGELPVTALVTRLKDADHAVRWRAAQALAGFGQAAQEAVPDLVGAMSDESEDSLVRWWAGHALKTIDPDAAAKAGLP
jgi:hypothetical protein